jgi:hypothetical protein
MRSISLLFRILLFWALFSFPITIPFLIFQKVHFAGIALGACGILFFLDHLRTYSWIKRKLAGKRDTLFGKEVITFRDKSGIFYLSAHPFRSGVQIWINQIILENSSPEDLKTILRKFSTQSHRGELLFDTYLMLWIHRFSSAIPKSNRLWIVTSEHRKKHENLIFPVWSILLFGCVFLVKIFLGKNQILALPNRDEKRLIQNFEKLAIGLSKRVPEAFEVLSVTPIFNEAILHYGRSCLWPKEELEKS